jgi:hypothetical protein
MSNFSAQQLPVKEAPRQGSFFTSENFDISAVYQHVLMNEEVSCRNAVYLCYEMPSSL